MCNAICPSCENDDRWCPDSRAFDDVLNPSTSSLPDTRNATKCSWIEDRRRGGVLVRDPGSIVSIGRGNVVLANASKVSISSCSSTPGNKGGNPEGERAIDEGISEIGAMCTLTFDG